MPDSNTGLTADRRTSADKTLQMAHAGLILMVPTVSAMIASFQLFSGPVPLWRPVIAVLGYLLTMMAITVGYHRLLAHKAFEASPLVTGILAVTGCMAGQGPPVYWVSNHRRHHRHVERTGDPHTPFSSENAKGYTWSTFLHSHIGWTFSHALTNSLAFSGDLLKSDVIRYVNSRYYWWMGMGVSIPVLIGTMIEPTLPGAWNGFVWGGGVRMFLTYHFTSSINSITHMFGYRRFETPDRSRNNIWLAIPTLGEAWHNNHHFNPSSAKFGRAWWEVDAGWIFICTLRTLGIVRHLKSGSAPAPKPQKGKTRGQ